MYFLKNLITAKKQVMVAARLSRRIVNLRWAKSSVSMKYSEIMSSTRKTINTNNFFIKK
jgi:hypothetical protein